MAPRKPCPIGTGCSLLLLWWLYFTPTQVRELQQEHRDSGLPLCPSSRGGLGSVRSCHPRCRGRVPGPGGWKPPRSQDVLSREPPRRGMRTAARQTDRSPSPKQRTKSTPTVCIRGPSSRASCLPTLCPAASEMAPQCQPPQWAGDKGRSRRQRCYCHMSENPYLRVYWLRNVSPCRDLGRCAQHDFCHHSGP